ncbi:MAG: ribonuclease P protein component [Rikenellaceae bacterium]|nr:ribonuclease P protein component [Rikenellaceae bacterium]MCL2692535.1 ribonuclease P protein component [Rikenellaceae bacterium]
MKPNSLPKSQRLSGQKAIDRLFASGSTGFVYPLRYLFSVEQAEGAGLAVLVVVPKRNHKRAVRRNGLKRRMREAFRTQCGELRAEATAAGLKVHIALLYSAKEPAQYDTIRDAVGRVIIQISQSLKTGLTKTVETIRQNM